MYEYKATVVRVKDGDTLVLDIDLGFNIIYKQQVIRLARINCPETSSEEGLKVKEIVTNLLLNKTVIINSIKDEKDKYGRYLAEIKLMDDTNNLGNINDYLLNNGYAVKYGSNQQKALEFINK